MLLLLLLLLLELLLEVDQLLLRQRRRRRRRRVRRVDAAAAHQEIFQRVGVIDDIQQALAVKIHGRRGPESNRAHVPYYRFEANPVFHKN